MEDSNGRYKMVYKKVWNHFCYPLGDDCKCRNLFEKNVRKSSAEETWEKPVQISDIEFWQEESDYERENEDNSPYWIIPQSKSLLSEEESKNIKMKH